MAKREDLNGLRFRSPGDAAIYLIDGGEKRHIVDAQTQAALFDGGGATNFDLTGIDLGPPIAAGTRLVRARGYAEIYLMDAGREPAVKRHILDPATMDRYHFAHGDAVEENTPSVVKAVPPGTTIQWPNLV